MTDQLIPRRATHLTERYRLDWSKCVLWGLVIAYTTLSWAGIAWAFSELLQELSRAF